MSDGERLKSYREELALNIQEAADRIGTSRSYLSRLESGKAPLGHVGGTILEGMAKLYGRNIDEIKYGPGKHQVTRPPNLQLPVQGCLPYRKGDRRKGRQMPKQFNVAASDLSKLSDRNNALLFQMGDDSLVADDIHAGDMLLVDSAAVIEDGRIYVVCKDDEYSTKRLQRHDNMAILHDSLQATTLAWGSFTIVGRVVKSYRVLDH